MTRVRQPMTLPNKLPAKMPRTMNINASGNPSIFEMKPGTHGGNLY